MQKRILVVDDNEKFRSELSRKFSEGGYEVLNASNGEEALQIYDRDPKVDLIFTDISMPVMNGYDLLEALSSRREAVPLIMFSADDLDSNRVKNHSGYFEFISKYELFGLDLVEKVGGILDE